MWQQLIFFVSILYFPPHLSIFIHFHLPLPSPSPQDTTVTTKNQRAPLPSCRNFSLGSALFPLLSFSIHLPFLIIIIISRRDTEYGGIGLVFSLPFSLSCLFFYSCFVVSSSWYLFHDSESEFELGASYV